MLFAVTVSPVDKLTAALTKYLLLTESATHLISTLNCLSDIPESPSFNVELLVAPPNMSGKSPPASSRRVLHMCKLKHKNHLNRKKKLAMLTITENGN